MNSRKIGGYVGIRWIIHHKVTWITRLQSENLEQINKLLTKCPTNLMNLELYQTIQPKTISTATYG